jgi:hypothetical protein
MCVCVPLIMMILVDSCCDLIRTRQETNTQTAVVFKGFLSRIYIKYINLDTHIHTNTYISYWLSHFFLDTHPTGEL